MTASVFLAPYIRSFFEDHLACRRNVSRNTIHSYRDSLKLLLQFVALQRRKSVAQLLVIDITDAVVIDFLTELEQVRGNSIQTRNHRLVSIRSLFEYIAAREPLLLDQCHKMLTIPRKRGAAVPEIQYLEREHLTVLLGTVARNSPRGRRDYALLLFMYNTGTRVQEVSDSRLSWLTLRALTKWKSWARVASDEPVRSGKTRSSTSSN